MKKVSVFFALVLMMLASATFATESWYITNVKILSVGQFHDSAHNTVIRYELGGNKIPPGNCGAGWAPGEGWVVARSTGQPGYALQTYISTAIAAQAQGLTVDLFLNDGCNSSNVIIDGGAIKGNTLGGIMIHHESWPVAGDNWDFKTR